MCRVTHLRIIGLFCQVLALKTRRETETICAAEPMIRLNVLLCFPPCRQAKIIAIKQKLTFNSINGKNNVLPLNDFWKTKALFDQFISNIQT